MYFLKIQNNLLKRCFINIHHRLISSQNIDKILIANRGEIACRVIKTAKKMGIQTVAVYSDADINSLHVSMADEAYHIGKPQSQESYLRGDKILQLAKDSKSDAIHPGYGFLSENYEFANLCSNNKIIFIGPPASAIRDMGIKSTSKEIMTNAGVPVIQGYHESDQSLDKLKDEAQRIGYPIMIKAVRGGGGKGMRIAWKEEDFEDQLESAKREAITSFGDDAMLLERFVPKPRHVEVQVFGDKHGNYVYLFERDCSVQRRHQKIIEEAPAPGISEYIRRGLGEAAVRAAKAVGYVGAGTVEFIFEPDSQEYFFMEMNTRLQVEHPITEMITGVDLVEWQIKVARNEKLPVTQDQLNIKGHSFEARIYAENPSEGFLPGAGPLNFLITPKPSNDVRVETGVRQGDEVSVYYDPMIAKLVVWAENRTMALNKLKTQLSDYNIAGLDTNIQFLMDLSQHKEFIAGNVHTDFIDQYKTDLLNNKNIDIDIITQAILGVVLNEEKNSLQFSFPFDNSTNWRLNHFFERKINLKFNNETFKAKITSNSPGKYKIFLNDKEPGKSIYGFLQEDKGILNLIMNLENQQKKARLYFDENALHLFTKDGSYKFIYDQKFSNLKESGLGANLSDSIPKSPMPGVVNKVWVCPGDKVSKGDPLVVIIAMKMEYVIKANKDGIIEKVYFTEGENVDKNSILVQFSEEK